MRINAVRLSGNIPMHYIKFDTVVLKQFCKNSAQGGFFGGAFHNEKHYAFSSPLRHVNHPSSGSGKLTS